MDIESNPAAIADRLADNAMYLRKLMRYNPVDSKVAADIADSLAVACHHLSDIPGLVDVAAHPPGMRGIHMGIKHAAERAADHAKSLHLELGNIADNINEMDGRLAS